MLYFILSQIMGGVALAFSIVSVFMKDKKSMFVLIFLSNFFYGLSFAFADALVACVNTLISLPMLATLYLYKTREERPPWFLFVIYSIIFLAMGFVFYSNEYDFIVMVTPILFILALFLQDMQLIRIMLLAPNAVLVFFDIIHGAYVTAILDLCDVCSIIVAMIIYYIKNKKAKLVDKKK